MVVTILALFGLYVTANYRMAAFFIFVVGATFSGRIIVGRFLYVEFTNASKLDKIMQMSFFLDPASYILITFYFQFISNSVSGI